jgi:DNA invertase Pin-like site-specific DNA recombinase
VPPIPTTTPDGKATQQPIDTGSAAGKAFLDVLGVFAEFETSLRRERQMEGVTAAKPKGVSKGPSTIDRRGQDQRAHGRGLRGVRRGQEAVHRTSQRLSADAATP